MFVVNPFNIVLSLNGSQFVPRSKYTLYPLEKTSQLIPRREIRVNLLWVLHDAHKYNLWAVRGISGRETCWFTAWPLDFRGLYHSRQFFSRLTYQQPYSTARRAAWALALKFHYPALCESEEVRQIPPKLPVCHTNCTDYHFT